MIPKILGYRVLVQAPPAPAGQVIIPETAQRSVKETEGIVVALGDGRIGSSGVRAEFDVKVGEHVIYSGYGGVEIEADGQHYKLIGAEDIFAVRQRQIPDAEGAL